MDRKDLLTVVVDENILKIGLCSGDIEAKCEVNGRINVRVSHEKKLIDVYVELILFVFFLSGPQFLLNERLWIPLPTSVTVMPGLDSTVCSSLFRPK